MTRFRILAAATAFAALAAVPAAADAQAPTAANEWQVRNAATVQTGTPYQLYNTRNNSQLGHDNRTFGVDLGWKRSGHFEFRRATSSPNVRDHRRGPITETENVAIYNDKIHRYLKYYKRGQWKAELEWSKTPVYEWQVRGQQGNRFALFNDRVDRFLVYQVKNYGINLGWLETGPPAPQTASVALTAQQTTQGWIPYLGRLGGPGTLLGVQNASQTATLLFVKPGKSTNDCSDPNATVRVAPGATMTAEQRKTLYGAETPGLPVPFLACVTTATPQSISLTFLNVTYRPAS